MSRPQVILTLGVVLAQIINIATGKYYPWGWRVSLGLAGLPAIILTIGGIVLPDTPNSLVERGFEEEGRRVGSPAPFVLLALNIFWTLKDAVVDCAWERMHMAPSSVCVPDSAVRGRTCLPKMLGSSQGNGPQEMSIGGGRGAQSAICQCRGPRIMCGVTPLPACIVKSKRSMHPCLARPSPVWFGVQRMARQSCEPAGAGLPLRRCSSTGAGADPRNRGCG